MDENIPRGLTRTDSLYTPISLLYTTKTSEKTKKTDKTANNKYLPENTEKTDNEEQKTKKISIILSSGAFIDSGATADFIDLRFCRKYGIPIVPRTSPASLKLIDGEEHSSRKIIF